ncbi:MAG TPA: ABC transporter ATP-binding protein [Stellaceae bacterium]|nr:ABC transporter ATP-binding protein [Stellaceae bacterium]
MSREASHGGLVLEGVEAGYGETVIVEAISLSVPPGGTLAVLGRNGVGKTTLLATIVGRTNLRAGRIGFAGRDISKLPAHRRARLGIGFVPQEREVFGTLTVTENLSVAGRRGKWSLPRIFELFPQLAERRRSRGNQLSGGEQQMLAIGRALMGNPTLLLMDEPLEGLAPVVVDGLLAALERLKHEDNLALVLIEQHARLALDFAAETIVLDRGRVVFSGESRDLLAAPDQLSELLGVTVR